MTEEQLQTKHDWDAVRKALEDLWAYTEEHEPHAVTTINAIQAALDTLPENDN